MADYYLGHGSGQVSSMTLLSASLAAIAIGGPLLGMMVFSFIASSMLLLVFSPLLLLFSSLLLGVAFLFVGTLAAFAVAAVMALTGLSMLGWITKETRVRLGGLSNLGDLGHRLKGKERDYWIDNLPTTTAYSYWSTRVCQNFF